MKRTKTECKVALERVLFYGITRLGWVEGRAKGRQHASIQSVAYCANFACPASWPETTWNVLQVSQVFAPLCLPETCERVERFCAATQSHARDIMVQASNILIPPLIASHTHPHSYTHKHPEILHDPKPYPDRQSNRAQI